MVDEEAEAAKKREAEMNAEIEIVKKEYEEKQRRKKEQKKKGDEEASKESKNKNEEEDDGKAKANRDAKVFRANFKNQYAMYSVLMIQIASIQNRSDARTNESSPRVFTLNK